MTSNRWVPQPRYEGRWDQAGYRQTEVMRDGPTWYYLWAWENPKPGLAIRSVEIVPMGHPFIIAGVTLGHLEEHPFVRQERRPVRVALKRAEDAAKPFDLDVQVDRGVATYIHTLPKAAHQRFLGDPFKGWGEAQNTESSPAYVEIAAIPSATVEVKRGGRTLGKVNWGKLEEKGTAATPRVSMELLDRGKNWVHVTVLDEDTGKPVPCRVHFRTPEGVPYQPHGYHNQVNSNLTAWNVDIGGDVRLGQITYAYIDGKCQGWLPRGDVVVDIARGFEYEPLRARVNIKPGQRELTLRIKRWTDLNARGWYSGDPHVHFMSAQGCHVEAKGEDLNVVNLLQTQLGSLFTDKEEFTGGPSVSKDGKTVVYVGQENRQHFLGHIILSGLKEPIMPWCADGPGEAELGGAMETTMSHWADACRAQGGTVIIPHFPIPNGEPATLITTGRVDGLEMVRHEKSNHLEYYRYLNCGYRVPLVGGTDKMGTEVPMGLYRTYVRIPDGEEFTYDNWCKNLAKGRTFLSGGPIIQFSVDGHEMGDTVMLSGPGTVEVEASVESIFPVHTLEVVQQGRVVASAESRKGDRKLKLKARLQVKAHTWLAARCGGPGYYNSVPHHDVWSRGVFAHTSPVYVACGGEWDVFDRDAAQYLLTLVDGALTYVRGSSGQFREDAVTHHHTERNHQAYLERPFLQAQEALRRKMAASRK